MSLISGLFTLPFGFANQAWKQTNSEIVLSNGIVEVRKGDSGYESLLQSLTWVHIKTAMLPFLEKIGVKKDLIFIEQANPGFCVASGTNMFEKGNALVMVAPGFYEADVDACSWGMKHEISHIKHNDTFTIPCMPGICQLAASIFGMRTLSFWPALGLAYTVAIVSHSLFSQWREAKADDFAIENSSNEELLGGRRLLTAVKEVNAKERNTLWKRIAIAASGDCRIDILHPSLTSRIQKIEKALRTRDVKIDIEAEKQKLDEFKPFIAQKMREVERQADGFFGVMKKQMSL